MAYTNIDDPSAHFQVKLWTGNATAGNTITLDGNSDMQPDWMWHKEPTDANGWHQMDSSRGPTYVLATQSTTAEYDVLNTYISSFNSNGFTAGYGDSSINSAGVSQCSWMWHCNGGTTSSNTDGSITTTTQVNSDAGFSIVTWAGGGTGSLGHGLGVVPDMWIVKNRDYAVSWAVGFSDSSILGGTSNYLSLNTSQAVLTYNNIWGSSPANSSTITMAGDRSVNISGDDYVGYFFKAKQGYSKFGKYVGNGNADGPFIYTGFKPAFIIVKKSSGTGNWLVYDNKRGAFNLNDPYVYANEGSPEATSSTSGYDFLSNGFKTRNTYNDGNVSGQTYIYMAFAESPFTTSSGIPTTAR
jgi:hypothetical protein